MASVKEYFPSREKENTNLLIKLNLNERYQPVTEYNSPVHQGMVVCRTVILQPVLLTTSVPSKIMSSSPSPLCSRKENEETEHLKRRTENATFSDECKITCIRGLSFNHLGFLNNPTPPPPPKKPNLYNSSITVNSTKVDIIYANFKALLLSHTDVK